MVHDQSASGQTLFIEPKQILEMNNRLRQQQIAERNEITRILAELSAELVLIAVKLRMLMSSVNLILLMLRHD